MYSRRQTLTIASSGTTSDAFNARDLSAFMLQVPAAFTGASVTFLVSVDLGVSYQPLLIISDNAVGTSAAAKALVTQGNTYALTGALVGCDTFKIVSASSEGASRSLVVVGSAP